MSRYFDIIYGEMNLPPWLDRFIFSPEILRLRGVGLSNVDPLTHKDFSAVSRWEHSISVAYLCSIFCDLRALHGIERNNLLLAALYHDVATPPFAHSAEYVLDSFSHEAEGRLLFEGGTDESYHEGYPVFQGELPKIYELVKEVARDCRIDIDVSRVMNLINGEDSDEVESNENNSRGNSWLICGTIDLDNIDNVVRSSLFMGLKPDLSLPLELVRWLSTCRSMPLLDGDDLPEPVRKWKSLKENMYDHYFNADARDIGRESLIHHIIRKLADQYPKRQIIWNTEDGMLSMASGPEAERLLKILIKHYQLSRDNSLIVKYDIGNAEAAARLSRPVFVRWLCEHLSGKSLIIHAIVKRNRGPRIRDGRIFPEPIARLFIFRIGAENFSVEQLPAHVLSGRDLSGRSSMDLINEYCRENIETWMRDRPWENAVKSKTGMPMSAIRSVPSWEFVHTRNKSYHSYPGTFVYAIPSNLITGLGLQGERILDPFGGTGQTAAEALKLGCSVISIDNNSVAALTQMARFTYLNMTTRDRLRGVMDIDITSKKKDLPEIPDREKWFNDKTYSELCSIYSFVNGKKGREEYHFLAMSFSAILTTCTHRAGEQHGHFADNTPLPKGVHSPHYRPAMDLFIRKIKANLAAIESFYAMIKRRGMDIQDTLKMAKIIRADFTDIGSFSDQISDGSIAGIITSPPYICMADYTLGQRLSYYWLFPERFDSEFKAEIGSRRSRFGADRAVKNYGRGLESFAENSRRLLRNGGYASFVIGAPIGNRIAKKAGDWYDFIENAFESHGFEMVYKTWRDMTWHRNHGYAKLDKEKIYVFRKK